MTISFRRLAAAASLVFASACASSSAGKSATQAHPYVVMVSFDAFRYDYIDRYHPSAIEDLAARGVRAEALIPSFPSKTFPNHYTLATGLYPGNHGITGNSFYDPARRATYKSSDTTAVRDGTWYSGEPIWVTAERNGVKSASFFWSGSEAAIGGVRPSYYEVYNGKVTNSARVNGVIDWLRKPAAARPHLVMLYFSEVDDTTHRFGPDTPHTGVAVADLNRALQQLLDSIKALPIHDSVNVVLVSDHGMVDTPPEKVIPIADLLLRNALDTARVITSDNGPTMSLWLPGDALSFRRVRDVLNTSMAHAHAYLREDAPVKWHLADNPRFGDVLVVADEGYILVRNATDRAPSAGSHGYDPYVTTTMRGIFLAAGPGVRHVGVIAPFENVNVYPFVAALLGLERVPAVDGSLTVLRDALVRR